MRLQDFLDPDTKWRSWATLQHYLSGFLLCGIFDAFLATGHAVALVAWTGLVYEVGQLDVAYNLKDADGQRYAGRPGYGIGPMDFLADMLGALTWVVVCQVVGL